MSRKSKAAQQQLVAEQQALLKQSVTWKRMLDRNDADMAAMLDLNRSLHAVKQALCQSSDRGELILLDLGQGQLRLSPDGRDELMRVVVGPLSTTTTTTAAATAPATKKSQDPHAKELMVLEPETELTGLQRELCIDFLLRRKLRRKLLSRVVRRTNRLAASMDGNSDVPAPPKYGDLRLQCDTEYVLQEYRRLIERQKEALQQIQALRDKDLNPNVAATSEKNLSEEVEVEQQGKEVTRPPTPLSSPVRAETTDPQETNLVPIDYAALQDYKNVYEKRIVHIDDPDEYPRYSILEPSAAIVQEDYQLIKGAGIGATHHSMSAAEKEIEFKRWQTTVLARIPYQPTYADLGLEHRVFFAEERRKRALEQLEQNAKDKAMNDEDDQGTSSGAEPSPKKRPQSDSSDDDDEHQMDLDKEKELEPTESVEATETDAIDGNDMDVDKKVARNSEAGAEKATVESVNKGGSSAAAIATEEQDDDWIVVDKPAGNEDTSLAAGLKDGADGKPSADDAKAAADKTIKSETKRKTDQDGSESGDSGQSDDESGEEDDDDDGDEMSSRDVTEKKSTGDSDDSSKSDEDDEAKAVDNREESVDVDVDHAKEEADKHDADEKPHPAKIVRPISFAPVPSFFDQDMRRIRNVQSDLLTVSVVSKAQQKLEEVVNEYNRALRTSIQLHRQRTTIQQQLNNIQLEMSNQTHIYKDQYNVQLQQAKKHWIAKRTHFEKEKLQRVLPSRNGKFPTGTQMTQRYMTHQDRTGICRELGTCMADIVDAVDNIAHGRIQNYIFNEPFIPPPPPPGFDPLTVEQSTQREANKRNELNNLTLKHRVAEEERSRAWKKMLKVKGDHKMQQKLYTSAGTYRIHQLDANNCNRFPMPNLQQCGLEEIPQMGTHLSAISSFTPSPLPTPPEPFVEDASRYCFTATRQRMAAVGITHVPPPPQPKQETEKEQDQHQVSRASKDGPRPRRRSRS